MKLEGQAGSSELFDLFQLLASTHRRGNLSVKLGQQERKVLFTEAGVTLMFEAEGHRLRLGDILVRRGRITRNQIEQVLQLQKTTGKKVGELLVQLGILKAEQVKEALAYQLEEELFELLTWEGATFHFLDENEAPVEQPSEDADAKSRKYHQDLPYFNIQTILMEAARRADQWGEIRKILKSEQTILIRRAQEWSAEWQFDNPEMVHRVWDLLDGTRNLADLIERTAFSRYQVFEAAFQLHRAQAVQLVGPEELLRQAEEKLVSGQTEYGLGLLAKACEGLGGMPELQVQAGQLYMWAGRDAEARTVLDDALHHLTEGGQLQSALKFLESLRDAYPQNAYPLERLVRLYRDVPDFDSAFDLSTYLLDIYHKDGDRERVTKLLRFLSEFESESQQDRLRLAKLMRTYGATDMAAEQYLTSGRAAQKAGSLKDALKYYREALHLDPNSEQARRRIYQLTVVPRALRRRLLKRTTLALVVLLAAVGVAAAIHSDLQKREDWQRILGQASQLMENHDYQAARQLVNTFADQTTLSTAARPAREYLRQIAAAENGYVAQCAQMDRRLWRSVTQADPDADYEMAVRAYEAVIAKATQPSVVDKAQQRLAELQERRRTFESHMEAARQAETRGELAAAIDSYLKAAQTEDVEFQRRGVGLPMMVTSDPPGAEVRQDRQFLGRTPLVVRHGLGQGLSLSVSHEGYLPGTIAVTSGENPTSSSVTLRQTRPPRWTYRAAGAVDVPVASDGNRVYLSSRAGTVTALEVSTGRVLWTRDLGAMSGSYVSPVSVQADALYVAVGDGRLIRMQSADGAVSWSQDLRGLLTGSPLFDAKRRLAIAACADGRVLAVTESNGDIRWALNAGCKLSGLEPLEDAFLCMGSDCVQYIPYEQSAARTSWKQGVDGGVSCPGLVTEERLYVPGQNGTLTVMDIRNGRVLSRLNLSANPLMTPVQSGEKLVVANSQGRVWIVGGKDCRTLAEMTLGETLNCGPAVSSTTAYVGTVNGSLVAMDMQSGKILWETVLDGAVQAPPRLVAGLCLVTTKTGTLYAVAVKER